MKEATGRSRQHSFHVLLHLVRLIVSVVYKPTDAILLAEKNTASSEQAEEAEGTVLCYDYEPTTYEWALDSRAGKRGESERDTA